ncbi:DUF551 domain-containing protein [Brevundimonas vesicularis]|uniref:DUF551 domain-containing protein n=1 Tax=Brevundimonas vesicularis TaxID=41276 RepID=A0A1Z3UCF7_BREVE|nr:DUF551 domain-containing protein [Brevundimonas vesicularis]ASE40948.1 hypothetical protein CEP68_16465 [Brevundimonas vesicularis]
MTQTPTDALRLVPDEEQIFAWLNRKYVQRAEERQRSMNLQYMEAETHDLSASLHRWLLAAAPASPLPGGGWQDISTAPKDGTPLLAGSIHHSTREVVCWQDGLPSGSMDTDAEWEGWVNDGPHKDRFYANPRYFTHWQPLPTAPTGDAHDRPYR